MKFKITFLFILIIFILNKSIAQNSFRITDGNVKVTDNVAIVLKDCQLQNNGTLTANEGTIEFKGTATKAQSEIGGTGTSTFHNLKINKSTSDAQLGHSIMVNNQLEMASGKLDLQNYNLTLGTTNGLLIGESETTHITSTSTGRIIKAVNLNAPNVQNPGNLGIEITSSENLGMTEIRRGHDHQTVPTGTSIFRHFTIVPTNNTGLGASLIFRYLEVELNGIPENNLALMENNNGWVVDGADSRNTTDNKLSFSGYDGLHQYTLGMMETQNITAEAGANQLKLCGTTAQLAAVAPIIGTGLWTATPIGGNFVDATQPNTQFEGQIGVSYTLTWTVSGASDRVLIEFDGDSDNDLVQNCLDVCEGVDDNGPDLDNDGAPDDCDCDRDNPDDAHLNLMGFFDRQLPTGLYQAALTITSDGFVEPSNSVIFVARNTITLEVGFHAKKASNFHAYIADCTPSTLGSRIAASSIELTNEEKNVTAQLTVQPNPFVYSTKLVLSLAEEMPVEIQVYDQIGRLMQTILFKQMLEEGVYKFPLDGIDLEGGFYTVFVKAANQQIYRKVILIKDVMHSLNSQDDD